MKTPDEIKKGLECCTPMWRHDHFVSCSAECPYSCEGIFCRTVLFEEVRARFKQLESRLAQVELERDAAVKDCSRFPCATCSDKENGDLCCNCNVRKDTTRTNYEWRGVCPENSKEESK